MTTPPPQEINVNLENHRSHDKWQERTPPTRTKKMMKSAKDEDCHPLDYATIAAADI